MAAAAAAVAGEAFSPNTFNMYARDREQAGEWREKLNFHL
jgi:hypothetical protein